MRFKKFKHGLLIKQKTIHINKKVVSFREDAINIKSESLKNSSDIYIDFSDVYFISRAFTDELLNVIEEIKKEGKKIHLLKMNSNLKKMIQLVKNGRKKIKKELKSA